MLGADGRLAHTKFQQTTPPAESPEQYPSALPARSWTSDSKKNEAPSFEDGRIYSQHSRTSGGARDTRASTSAISHHKINAVAPTPVVTSEISLLSGEDNCNRLNAAEHITPKERKMSGITAQSNTAAPPLSDNTDRGSRHWQQRDLMNPRNSMHSLNANGYDNPDNRPNSSSTKRFESRRRGSSNAAADGDDSSSPPAFPTQSQEGPRQPQHESQSFTPWKMDTAECSPFYSGAEEKSSAWQRSPADIPSGGPTTSQVSDTNGGHNLSRYASLRRFIPFRGGGGGLPPISNKSSTEDNVSRHEDHHHNVSTNDQTTLSERILDSAKSSLSRALKATINRSSVQNEDPTVLAPSSMRITNPHNSQLQILKAGIVYKWTNYYDKWRPRYFQVIPGALQYSEGECGPIKEQLALRYCAIRLRVNPGELDIIRPGQSNISLRFSSKEERVEWIKALTHAKLFMPLSTSATWELPDGNAASPAKPFVRETTTSTDKDEKCITEQQCDISGLTNDMLMPHYDLMSEIEPDTIPLVKLKNLLTAHEIEVRRTVDEIKRIESRFLQTLALIRHPTLGSKIKETAVSLIRQVDTLQACITSHLGVADALMDEEQEERQVLQSSLRKIARENYKLGLRLQRIPRSSTSRIRVNNNPPTHPSDSPNNFAREEIEPHAGHPFEATRTSVAKYIQDEKGQQEDAPRHCDVPSSPISTPKISPEAAAAAAANLKNIDVQPQSTQSDNENSNPQQDLGIGEDEFFDVDDDDELSSNGGKPGSPEKVRREQPSRSILKDSAQPKLNSLSPEQQPDSLPGEFVRLVSVGPREETSSGNVPLSAPSQDDFDDDDDEDDEDDEGAGSSVSGVSVRGSHPRRKYMGTGASVLAPQEEERYNADKMNLGLKKPDEWTYRTELPIVRTSFKMSIWSLLKDCVGKDLTRIALPVYFNEPTSFLQRMAEDFQYAWMLEKVGLERDPYRRLLWMALFTVTPWASAVGRTYKPFNPLLGETYEIIHRGYRFQSEQVGHHPPTTAYHVDGANFESWGHIVLGTKFTGKSLEIAMKGTTNFRVGHPDGHHERFTSKRARMMVNNIIFGKISMDVVGTYVITNHTTGDFAVIDFPKKGWWSSELHPVRGAVFSVNGYCHWRFSGVWSQAVEIQQMDPMRVPRVSTWYPHTRVKQNPELRYGSRPLDFQVDWNALSAAGLGAPTLGWKPEKRPPYSDKYYEFGYMTFELNEISPLYDKSKGAIIPPTDSRYRPDQRALEEGEVERSNEEKQRLEEKQRAAARMRSSEGNYEPLWYHKKVDELTGNSVWVFDQRYWKGRDNNLDAEEAHDLLRDCADIF